MDDDQENVLEDGAFEMGFEAWVGVRISHNGLGRRQGILGGGRNGRNDHRG